MRVARLGPLLTASDAVDMVRCYAKACCESLVRLTRCADELHIRFGQFGVVMLLALLKELGRSSLSKIGSVLFSGAGVKVARVDACPDIASVVDLQSVGDGADVQLVREPVRTEDLPWRFAESAIAVRSGAGPYPAAVWPVAIDLLPKALFGRARSAVLITAPTAEPNIALFQGGCRRGKRFPAAFAREVKPVRPAGASALDAAVAGIPSIGCERAAASWTDVIEHEARP